MQYHVECQILYNQQFLLDKNIAKNMSSDRQMYPATCADCKKETQVPFQPKEGRPVYCRECLPKHRGERRI